MITGYMHAGYAQSLAEFGTPRKLPRCGGWILERQIPGSPYRDAMGPYPLFACRDWTQLKADLDDVGGDLVSLAFVADTFGKFDLTDLQRSCDIVLPFKEHFVADRREPMESFISKDHRRISRRALRNMQVERCSDPREHLDEWVGLYACLIARHNIRGIRAFSRECFAGQLAVPGMVMLRALSRGATVGASLLYLHDDVAYAHLAAYSPEGYEVGAPYAMAWVELEDLARQVRWLDYGGGVGTRDQGHDGLAAFKKGWATGTRPVYFCGRILNRERYEEIVKMKSMEPTSYFPAYRQGEFG